MTLYISSQASRSFLEGDQLEIIFDRQFCAGNEDLTPKQIDPISFQITIIERLYTPGGLRWQFAVLVGDKMGNLYCCNGGEIHLMLD
jgi:hypothetical protein